MKAVSIEGHTLLGVSGERPSQHGNCFSIRGNDGMGYKIVNFNLENLEALQERGLTWPIACEVLHGAIAIIHDPRIGERWYQNDYCSVCCPESLLPVTQQQRQQREEMRGNRETRQGWIKVKLPPIDPEFP